MATYRFEARIISRTKGRSATAAAAYRSGEQIVDFRDGIVHDYTRRGGVASVDILAPTNAADWVFDRTTLWNRVEGSERRKDAQLAREVVLSLPYEIDDAARRELVHAFVREQFVDRGMIADVAIHRPHGKGDDRNHHAHVMLTMRGLANEGFGGKERGWNDSALLAGWRDAWEMHLNRALDRAVVPTRVSARSLAAQGLDREPEPKLGPVASKMEREGRRSHAGDDRRKTHERNAERVRLREQRLQYDLELREREQKLRNELELQERQQRHVELERNLERQRLAEQLDFREEEHRRIVLELLEAERERAMEHEREEARNRELPEDAPGIRHPDRSRQQAWREQLLTNAYQRDMRDSDLARFWRIESIDGGLVFENRGGWVIDVGDRLVSREGNAAEIGVMLELASVKRWDAVEFTGSDDFKARAMRAALRQGLAVHAEGENRRILEIELAGEQRRREAQPVSGTIGTRYTGVIEAIDDEHVFQRVDAQLVAHRREMFEKNRVDDIDLEIGRNVEINYGFKGPVFTRTPKIEWDLPKF